MKNDLHLMNTPYLKYRHNFESLSMINKSLILLSNNLALVLRTTLFCLVVFANVILALADIPQFGYQVIHQESVEIAGKIVGRYFFVEFSTPSNIIPTESQYAIAVYQNQQIPYYQPIKPLALEQVQCKTGNCSQAVEAPITQADYTLGIESSNSVKTIAATLNFSPGNTTGVPFNSSINIKAIGINSIIISYDMPSGYQPTDSGAWIGIWEGSVIGSIEQAIGRSGVNSMQSSSEQAINNLALQINNEYTIGFFSGESVRDLVSFIAFKTISLDKIENLN